MSPKARISARPRKQTHLLPENDQSYIAKGPIFDKKNYRKYLLKNMVIGLVVFAGAVGAYITTDKILERYKKSETSAQPVTIIESVQINDSQTKIARRAIADYLAPRQNITLSPAQKLFIETNLVQSHKSQHLTVNANIEFQISEIESLISQSQGLTASQLQKWSDLSRGIQF